MFVAGDETLLCAGNTYKRFLSLTTIFNIKHARHSFSSLMTEDKISVASDKNCAVCARLYLFAIAHAIQDLCIQNGKLLVAEACQ